MGSITSVYVKTDPPAGTEEPKIEESTSNLVDLVQRVEPKQEDVKRVVELRVSHSLHSPDHSRPTGTREEDMGKTIQHLAEENFKLVMVNRTLEKELCDLRAPAEMDIFGEPTEQKLKRLERLLHEERREKWEAIEQNERTRVDLINCQAELLAAKTMVAQLEEELNTVQTKRQITEDCQQATERLTEAHGVLAGTPRIPEDEEEGGEEEVDGAEEAETQSDAREKEMERFRADLSSKREARQRALAAVSQEINQLREQLEKERELRQEMLNLAAQQGSTTTDIPDSVIQKLTAENQALKQELRAFAQDKEKFQEYQKENDSLRKQIRLFQEEIRNVNTTVLQLKNDLKHVRKNHDRLSREKNDIEVEIKRNEASRKQLEEDKERMWREYDNEKTEIKKRTAALKEVIEISRQMLAIRETQIQDLRAKLKDIEEQKKAIEEESLKMEYEKQLQNIKKLKGSSSPVRWRP